MSDKYNLVTHARSIFPWFWQNTLNNELCDVLVEGVFGSVNRRYADKEANTTAKAGYTIQRLSLEISLNDQFDEFDRRIVIINSVAIGSGFVFNEIEAIQPEQENYSLNANESGVDFWVYNTNELGSTTTTDFVVECPISLQSSDSLIRAWVDYVLISGTKYIINYV